MGNLKSITEIDFQNLIKPEYFPSPDTWEDQVLYFLLLDGFSDGKENDFLDNDGNIVTAGNTVKYLPADFENAIRTTQDAEIWSKAGQKFVGGNLRGLKSKIDYLKRLRVYMKLIPIVEARNGKAVRLTIPAAGFVIYG